MADPGVTPSAPPGPRPKQMPKRGIHKEDEVQVVASCPEDHHDRVVHICKESGMFKAFGKQGEFSDQLKSGARWFDLWKAKVCQTVLVATMHAECSVVRFFCVEGGPHCDEEFGTIPDLKKAVKDDVKKQNGREVEVVCEWMTMELFERNFGFGIHVKPDGKERKARLLGILGKDPQLAESVAVMKKHVSEEALRTCKRVVIIGETGAGKSAFCGLLEGSLQFVDGHWTSTFKLGHGGSSETNEPKLLAAQWRVRDDVLPILLLDTPGLGDSRGPQKDDEHMAEVARWVNGLGHVHAMVILLNNASRISLSLRENLQFFQRMFGKEMWDHSLMVVNRWSHGTRSQKKRQAGKLQSPKQFEEEFRQMLQQDPSGDGEDSDIGVGLSKERAEKLPFFFIDTHYDHDDEDEVKSMEHELREMKRWLRSLLEWKVGANSQSEELKDLILAVKTTGLAEPLKEALQTALNVAHRSSPPKDLTQEKLDAVEEEIRCRHQEEERERLQKLSLEHQKEGVAPLPVVRLCFVGRGRAGKTTTLRRLKGESLRDNEPSTHGLDVWAGQVEADLQADLKKTHPWKRWEESMHLTALKDRLLNLLPKGPETDALTAQNADEQPDDMLEPQGLIEPEAGSKDDKQAQSTQGLNEPEHATSVASQGPKASQPDALLESSAAAQPTQGLNKPEEHATSVASQGPTANEQPQEDTSSSSGPKMCGPVVLDEDMLSKLGSQKAGIDVRLQCWDFPGQEEYALLNQLHFSERAIYLVFLDLTGQLEDEWRHLSFWLWKIVRFSTEKDAWPPILLIGTKAGARNRCVTESELRKRLEDLQSRVPRLKEQLQPHPADLGSKCTKCPWLFPIENKGENFEAWVSPLRMQLQRMALQFVSPRDLWEAEKSDGSVVPRFVGLQAETFPLTWLRAHDLLTRLGSGFRARAERVDVKKVAPSAEPGQRFKIKDYLRVTIDKDWLILPPGAFIGLHSQDKQDDDLREEELSLDVSCDFLELKAVQGLLRGMQPQGLSHQDTEEVLKLLSTLGIVVWIDKAKLRETVMLNPRQVAVAMANLIALCFGAHNFEHKDDDIKVIRKIEDISESDLLRFRSSGIATQDLIRGVWKKDFDEASQQLLQEVLLRNDLMCGRLVQNEFLLPSCLPMAHCAEEAFRETNEVLYLDVGGLLSPNFFPALAHLIYRSIKLEDAPRIWKPGPPQVFRNRGDLHSETHSVFTSMFPVNAPSNQSLLRILVRGKDKKANCAIAQEVKRALLNDILGFYPGINIEKDPDSFFRFKGVAGKETLERERSFARHPCLNSQCNLTCSLCRVSELLQERFLPDLSPGLRSIVENAAVQRHTRPAGSFRFKAMQFPGDVDLEEYLVIDAKSKDEALPTLCRTIQKMFRTLSAQNSDVQVFMGGLKAGSNPRQNVPGVQKEWLKWSQKELCDCKKAFGGVNEAPGVMTLREALEEGHETWTAKIDMFAKVCPFEDSEATPRFFEITNVLRAGYFEGSKPIQPITKEKDSLQGIEMNLKKYSSEEPNAMKYVKRLWERSAYLAERGFDLDWHANMLEALRPLLSHWSAELSQIAAHVETLTKMMKSGRREVIEHALYDLPTLCQSLRSLQSRLESEKGSEKEAAHDGLERIRDAMKYIPEETPSESGTEKKLCEGLHKAQLLLESCVEPVVISKLGSFEFPVAKRLGELWQFPSDHPPIAAKLTLAEHPLNVASWNVLNRNYYKYIDADTQGLKGSQITTLHEAETRENVIIEKIQEMLLKTHIHILCLQECWPELIAELKEALGESLQFKMICSGDEQDKNQEVIVYDSKLRVMYVHHHAPFSENSKKVVTEVHFQLETESLRVVTTHVPGAPFGCARREFADRLAKIVNGDKLPTVLMADLNFPEKAVHPLLLDRGLEDIYFVPTPYPTNICQGSLLPKRIDSIAVINHQVAGSKLHATAIKANELLDGLDKVVELLQSRSAEPLTPTRYHSDKVETDAEKISRLERELHAARQRVKSLQSTIDSQNEERAREALLPHRPTDAPSGHFRRKVQEASSVHRVEPEKL